ncbi:enoyl-CoA-hydratase DpgB [Actinocorallia aurantiaca]|uniref:Enoyl-CoA hydratase/isomerase family protein n=1 Tax=Actinocorallia aurantiaca TaxID=46204 RepID=A0ABP6GNW7_9ACTN
MSSADLAPLPLSPCAALDVDGDRPLSAALVAEVHAFCDLVEDAPDGTAAVVRLSGTESSRLWPGPVGIDLVSRWEKALRRLERAPAARIAIASGLCGGPALEVLLTCDHRIGAPGVRFEFPVRDGGVWAGMAVHRLVAQSGGAVARRMVLFGAALPAERALADGLLDEIVEDPEQAAALLAGSIGRLASGELAIRRRLVHDAAVTGFEEALGMHLAACERTLSRTAARGRGGVPGMLP